VKMESVKTDAKSSPTIRIQDSSQICRVCGTEAGNRIHSVREMMLGLREQFHYLECQACGCLQLVDVPVDLARYYPSAYTAFGARNRDELSPYQQLRYRIRRQRNKAYFRQPSWIESYLIESYDNLPLQAFSRLGVSHDARILDIGCGSGVLLADLKELGYKNLLGLDRFVPQAVADKHSVRIVKGELRDLNGTSWDVITLNHSLEHMAEQSDVLRAVASLLDSAGRCLVRIPVLGWAWEHYGVNWAQIDAPRHFFLHTTKSFSLLAASAGLDVVDISYDSTELQFWVSELYSRDIPLSAVDGHRPQTYFSRSELQNFRTTARELNTKGRGDQAIFTLRKS
jgi:2-polyprenyl-3-methyl-5-hydroxy-6-metoxy-1,4-benzoquinol methylase